MVIPGINSSPVYIFNLKEFLYFLVDLAQQVIGVKNHYFSEAGSFLSALWQYPAPLTLSDYQVGLFHHAFSET